MTNDQTTPAKTGALRYIGEFNLGVFARYRYYACVDCGSEYPDAQCNGRMLTLCPWCRPDSEPWKNGRGR
jgi:hypothetical protein